MINPNRLLDIHNVLWAQKLDFKTTWIKIFKIIYQPGNRFVSVGNLASIDTSGSLYHLMHADELSWWWVSIPMDNENNVALLAREKHT